MLWFKKKVIEVEEEEVKPSIEEILNDPWCINKEQISKDIFRYTIEVFRFDISKWDDISMCSKSILGIDRKEFSGYMREMYDVNVLHSFNSESYVRFFNLDEVKQLIVKFRPYYDSYHIPRAVADRLTKYDEENGGFPVPMHISSRQGNIHGLPFQLKSVK